MEAFVLRLTLCIIVVRMTNHQYDILIVGAGPAGTSTAIALADSGLKVALLDKANFPRDKICGDFVAGKGIRAIKELSPRLYNQIIQFPEKATNKSTELYIGKRKPLHYDWVLTSYTIRREHFDQLLLNEVLESGCADFFPGDGVKTVNQTADGIVLTTKNGSEFRAKLVIGADGAHSVVARQLAGFKVDREHYGGSIRAYFSGVTNIQESVNEVYIDKEVVPGYFWLFPVSSTTANVGLGMHSRYITKNKIDLKARFYDYIQQSPVLQQKLGKATMEGELAGFGLPFFSKKFTISGDRYLLTGDAACLIDPSNGEGIMLAIISGQLAAKTVKTAFEKQDFSAAHLDAYTQAVHQKWWKEMRNKAWMVNAVADKFWLLNIVGGMTERSAVLRRWLKKLI